MFGSRSFQLEKTTGTAGEGDAPGIGRLPQFQNFVNFTFYGNFNENYYRLLQRVRFQNRLYGFLSLELLNLIPKVKLLI